MRQTVRDVEGMRVSYPGRGVKQEGNDPVDTGSGVGIYSFQESQGMVTETPGSLQP